MPIDDGLSDPLFGLRRGGKPKNGGSKVIPFGSSALAPEIH
jgi:hypothetical protein